jgi:hypothetical protein
MKSNVCKNVWEIWEDSLSKILMDITLNDVI